MESFLLLAVVQNHIETTRHCNDKLVQTLVRVPAALGSTFVTSVAGVVTFTILAAHHGGPVAPDWPTGIALGIGGLAGAYTGARIQSRIPDALIRRLVGILVLAIGARYLWAGLS